MKYKTKFFSLLILTLILIQSCYSSEHPIPHETVTHIVIIWLKKPGDQTDKAALINATKSFSKIPGIKSVRVGAVIKSQRPVVDSSYDLGVSMEFESLKALKDYDRDPIHQKAIEETLKPLVSKFIIYDFVNE